MERPCLSSRRRTKSPEICLNKALRYAFVIPLFCLLAACGSDGSSRDAATDTTLEISWLPNPDNISGYMVYYGPTEDTATTVASNLPIESGSFNPASPSMEYNAGLDLGLDHGASVCFRIRAYNDVGLSNWSGSACGIV